MAFPGGHTIYANYGIETKDAKDALDDIKRHAERHGKEMGGVGERVSKLFGLEPMGERRMRGAMERIIGDLTSTKSGAEAATGAIGTLGRSLSLGMAGAGLVAITAGLQKGAEHGEELRQSLSEIQKQLQGVHHAAKFASSDEGIGAMTEKSKEAQKTIHHTRRQLDHIDKHPFINKVSSGIRDIFAHPLDALVPFGASSRIAKNTDRAEADKKQKEATKDTADYQEKSNKAMDDAVRLQELLIRGTEEEQKNFKIDLESSMIRKNIEQSRLPDQDKLLSKLEHETRLKREEASLSQQERKATMDSASRMADIAESGLTKEEQSLALAKEKVRAAEDQERTAQSQGPEQQQQAQTERRGAVSGQVGAESSQLEREGAEEEMSPQEKYAQQGRRLKQREGLQRAFARHGMDSTMVDAPKWGEADYDPLATFKARRSKQINDEAQAQAEQSKRQQDQQRQEGEQRAASDEESKGLLGRYQQTHPDMTGVDPGAAIEQQRNLEKFNKTPVQGMQGQGDDMFSHSSARDNAAGSKLVKDDSGLAHQMDRAPADLGLPRSKRKLESGPVAQPDATPDAHPAPDTPNIPPPVVTPQPQQDNTPQPSPPPSQAGATGGAGADKIVSVMREIWGS